MKKSLPLMMIALLAACQQSETPVGAEVPSVDALVANPERLKELSQQCKTDRAKLGDELCNRVAEAINRRFFGSGTTPYSYCVSNLSEIKALCALLQEKGEP